MSAAKFFKDNIDVIPQTDHLNWNLYRGLLALTQQLANIEHELHRQKQQLSHIEQLARSAASR